MRTQSAGMMTRFYGCSTLALLLSLGAGCTNDQGLSPGSGKGGTTAGSGGASASGGSQGTGASQSSSSVTSGGGSVGTAGAVGNGGTTGTGGSSARGGTLESGGKLGSGGASATAGASASAGMSGSGGASSSGGALGSGGRSGSGGASSTGGALGSGGRTTGGSTGSSGGAADGGASSGGEAVKSAGCGKTSALKNNGYNTLGSRQYYLRLPANYDNTHPHRLILGLHGATGKGTDVAPGFWGLYALSNGSTIFIAPDASGGLWSAASDTTFVGDILKAVEADLCIDTTRVMLEGFSQGAAMSWTLACSLPKVFRAVVGHSGGGVTPPKSCEPVAYFGSGGLQENVTQTSQSDQFAKWNGCTIETFAKPSTGGHACYDYKGCPAGYPVRWCPFDGQHTPSPNDSGKSSSWMPSEVWPFFSQF
jgi:poly(3-hydroxybutyrate) depolymerase